MKFLKRSLIVAAVGILIAACNLMNVKPTWPEGAKLCHTDYDCADNQYCGFQPPYTAAICRNGGVGTNPAYNPQ